jgi:hypothetical protein
MADNCHPFLASLRVSLLGFSTELLGQDSVDIITVQHLLGHARISMTARYAHSPDQARVAAVERLGGLFDSQPAPKRPQESNMPNPVMGYKPKQVSTIGP